MTDPRTARRFLAATVVLSAMFAFTSSLSAQAAPADNGCPPPRRPGGQGGPAAPPTEASQPAGPAKKRLLIWADTRNGIGQHDIAHPMAIIEELGFKTGLYDSWIRTDSAIISKNPKMTTGEPASGGPSLCNVDAIFFLGAREVELDAQGRADLLWFVHDAGKGFVSAHTGTTSFMSWPEFNDLIGGQFDNHPWGITDARVLVEDPNFPGIKAFGSPSFERKEEFYQIKNFKAGESHLIMRLDTSNLDMTKPQVQAGDYPFPLTWAKMYGKGRVFYSALGHAPATWDDPKVQQMYLEAIKWSLGMIEADVTPNPLPAKPTPPAPPK
jgi:type 1 glutamine amidotransferase